MAVQRRTVLVGASSTGTKIGRVEQDVDLNFIDIRSEPVFLIQILFEGGHLPASTARCAATVAGRTEVFDQPAIPTTTNVRIRMPNTAAEFPCATQRGKV